MEKERSDKVPNKLYKRIKIHALYDKGGWSIDLKYNKNRLDFINKYYFGINKKAFQKTEAIFIKKFYGIRNLN